MKTTYNELVRLGFQMFSADECTFSPNSYKLDRVWAPAGGGFQVDHKFLHSPLVLVYGVIAAERGVVLMNPVQKTEFKKGFNSDDICDFMVELRDAVPEYPIGVFMDNASIHKTRYLKDLM